MSYEEFFMNEIDINLNDTKSIDFLSIIYIHCNRNSILLECAKYFQEKVIYILS